MTTKNWPDGDAVSSKCPHCGHTNEQETAVVRELGVNCRDAHCDACGCDYHIEARAGVVTAHRTILLKTARGLQIEIDPATPAPAN